MVKVCTKCSKTKKIEDYSSHPKGKDGIYSICKKCACTDSKKYYHDNIEIERKKGRERMRNKDRVEYQTRWRELNKDYYKKRYKEDEKFRARMKYYGHKRRALIKISKIDQETLNFLINIKNENCFYCGEKAEVADHIIPLSKGGIHHHSNLAPACNKCNWSKNDKLIEEFLVYRNGNF